MESKDVILMLFKAVWTLLIIEENATMDGKQRRYSYAFCKAVWTPHMIKEENTMESNGIILMLFEAVWMWNTKKVKPLSLCFLKLYDWRT